MWSKQRQSHNINSTDITVSKLYIGRKQNGICQRFGLLGMCHFKGLAHGRLCGHGMFCILTMVVVTQTYTQEDQCETKLRMLQTQLLLRIS